MIVYKHSLAQLGKLRAHWGGVSVGKFCTAERKQAALDAIDKMITARTTRPVRCSLPKKEQRKFGLLPQL